MSTLPPIPAGDQLVDPSTPDQSALPPIPAGAQLVDPTQQDQPPTPNGARVIDPATHTGGMPNPHAVAPTQAPQQPTASISAAPPPTMFERARRWVANSTPVETIDRYAPGVTAALGLTPTESDQAARERAADTSAFEYHPVKALDQFTQGVDTLTDQLTPNANVKSVRQRLAENPNLDPQQAILDFQKEQSAGKMNPSVMARGGSEAMSGAMGFAKPIMVAGVATAPLKAAMYYGAGILAGQGSGEVAQKMGATPDEVEFFNTAGFFIPSVLIGLAGVKSAEIPEGVTVRDPVTGEQVPVRGSGVAGKGFKAQHAVTDTGEHVFQARVGPFSGKVQFGRTPPETAPEGPAARPSLAQPEVLPPEPQPQPDAVALQQRAQQATVAETAASAQSISLKAAQIAGLAPPPPPAPKPGEPGSKQAPLPAGMENGQITQQTVDNAGKAISALPPAVQSKGILEATGNLAKWMFDRKTFVGPDGKVVNVDSQKAAQTEAVNLINAEVERQSTQKQEADKAQQDAQDAQKKALEQKQKNAETAAAEREEARQAAEANEVQPLPNTPQMQKVRAALDTLPADATKAEVILAARKAAAGAKLLLPYKLATQLADEHIATRAQQEDAAVAGLTGQNVNPDQHPVALAKLATDVQQGDTAFLHVQPGTKFKPAGLTKENGFVTTNVKKAQDPTFNGQYFHPVEIKSKHVQKAASGESPLTALRALEEKWRAGKSPAQEPENQNRAVLSESPEQVQLGNPKPETGTIEQKAPQEGEATTSAPGAPASSPTPEPTTGPEPGTFEYERQLYKEASDAAKARGINPETTEEWGTAIAEEEARILDERKNGKPEVAQSPAKQNEPVAAKVEEPKEKPAEIVQSSTANAQPQEKPTETPSLVVSDKPTATMSEDELRAELAGIEKHTHPLYQQLEKMGDAAFAPNSKTGAYTADAQAISDRIRPYAKRTEFLRAELKEHERKAQNEKNWAATAKRIADAPVFQRRNGWEIVKDGGNYVLRDPNTKEEVYTGRLERARTVADESKPEAPASPVALKPGQKVTVRQLDGTQKPDEVRLVLPNKKVVLKGQRKPVKVEDVSPAEETKPEDESRLERSLSEPESRLWKRFALGYPAAKLSDVLAIADAEQRVDKSEHRTLAHFAEALQYEGQGGLQQSIDKTPDSFIKNTKGQMEDRSEPTRQRIRAIQNEMSPAEEAPKPAKIETPLDKFEAEGSTGNAEQVQFLQEKLDAAKQNLANAQEVAKQPTGSDVTLYSNPLDPELLKRYIGQPLMKMAAPLREALEKHGDIAEVAHTVDGVLRQIDKSTTATTLGMKAAVRAMADPRFTHEDAVQVFDAREDPAIRLTPKQTELRDSLVAPLNQATRQEYVIEQLIKSGKFSLDDILGGKVPEDEVRKLVPNSDNYQHRIAVGKDTLPERLVDENAQKFQAGGGKLSKTFSSEKARTFREIHGTNGEREAVGVKGDRVVQFVNKDNAGVLDARIADAKERLAAEKAKPEPDEEKNDNLQRQIDELNGQKQTVADGGRAAVDIGPYRSGFITTQEIADKAAAPLERQLDGMMKEWTILHASQKRAIASDQRIWNLYNKIDDLEKHIAAVRASVGPEEQAKTGLTDADLEAHQQSDIDALGKRIEKLQARQAKLQGTEGRSPAQDRELRNIPGHIAEAKETIDSIRDAATSRDLEGRYWQDKNGNLWKFDQGTAKFISERTGQDYFRDARLAELINHMEVDKAMNAAIALEKTKSLLEDAGMAVKVESAKNAPDGWKPTTMPQFRNYYFPEQIADTLDHFQYKQTRKPNVLTQANSALLQFILMNPGIHWKNIVAAWGTGKAAEFFSGKGLDPRWYADQVKAGTQAANTMRDIGGPEYQRVLRAGLDLRGADSSFDATMKDALRQWMDQLNLNPQHNAAVSALLGVKNAAKFFQKWNHELTFGAGDVATLQSFYAKRAELVRKGMDSDSAEAAAKDYVHQVGVGEYTTPARVAGSAKLGMMLDTPALNAFWPYHFGYLWRPLAKAIGDAVGPDRERFRADEEATQQTGETVNKMGQTPWEQRRIAIARLLFLTLWATQIQPYLNKKAKEWLGDLNAEFVAGGPTKLASDIYEAFLDQHNIGRGIVAGAAKGASELVMPSPGLRAAVGVVGNYDTFLGRHVYNPNGEPQEISKEVGMWLLKGTYPAQIQGASVRGGWKQALEKFAGFNFPLHNGMKAAMDIRSDESGKLPPDPVKSRTFKAILAAAQQSHQSGGNDTTLADALRDSGKLSDAQRRELNEAITEAPIVFAVRGLEHPQDFWKVYSHSTEDEKSALMQDSETRHKFNEWQKELRSEGKTEEADAIYREITK